MINITVKEAINQKSINDFLLFAQYSGIRKDRIFSNFSLSNLNIANRFMKNSLIFL